MVKGRKEKKNRERFTFYSYGLLYASRLYKCTIAIIINETCKYIYSATNNFFLASVPSACCDRCFSKWPRVISCHFACGVCVTCCLRVHNPPFNPRP